MVDPTTANIGLAVPTRGSDSGTWDSPLNSNSNAVDGLFGGVVSLTLTAAATTTLTLPAGFTPTPGAGPVQSQNAMIKLSGTLTGNNVLVCTRPGFFIVYNNCTVGSFVVTMSNGSGSTIGLPPGALWHVFNDGTNYYHCNLPLVGGLQHLTGFTATPAWISASTLPPFLVCDGSVYNVSAYPNLGAQLGSTFGGNGATTFGVPDLRGRLPLAYDGGQNRVTAAGSGINGTTLGAAGGNELMQSHTHAFTGTQQTWALNSPNVDLGTTPILQGSGAAANAVLSTGTPNVTVTPAGTNSTTGSGSSQNMPPVQVTGIWLVRAA